MSLNTEYIKVRHSESEGQSLPLTARATLPASVGETHECPLPSVEGTENEVCGHREVLFTREKQPSAVAEERQTDLEVLKVKPDTLSLHRGPESRRETVRAEEGRGGDRQAAVGERGRDGHDTCNESPKR